MKIEFEDHNEITPEEKAYNKYIKNHKNNVKRAYENIDLRNILKRNLDFKENQLIQKINNHDNSKYDVQEFEPYRARFYPRDGEKYDEKKFKEAWFHHLHNNDHHPEYWTYVDDDNKKVVLDMPDICIAEMILDWFTFCYKNNNPKDTVEYWRTKGVKKPLSSNTKSKVARIIEQIDYEDIKI